MAAEDYIRVYWSGSSTAINIVSANAGTDVFVVAGDKSRLFMVGTVFLAAGTTAGADDGSYTSTGATYDEATGNTTITVAAVPSTQGAAGTLVISNVFVEFGGAEYARLVPRWSNPAVTDDDRWDVAHRLQPVDSVKQQRYCKGVMLIIEPEDIDKLDTAGTTWWEQLYALSVKLDTQFIIFQTETIVRGSSERTIKRYFKGYIRDMEDLLATLADVGSPARVEIPFDVIDDGVFTVFANTASAAPRTRPGA